MKINRRLQSVISVLLAVLLLGAGTMPFGAAPVYAKTGETVRVGYFSEPGMMNGAAEGEIKSGYTYDYLQELASYAGWRYEYVYGSFSDLYDMLLNGEIDMLPYLTKTEERERLMLFPDKPMGEEEFYISSMTAEKLHDDLRELQGAKIGTEKGTFHIGPFKELIAEKNITCELIEYKDNYERWADLSAGKLDYTLEESTIFQTIDLHAVYEFNERSPFYIGISSLRPDLLEEFNSSFEYLEHMIPGFIETLNTKYFMATPLLKEIPAEGLEWLSSHASIRIGTYDNDEPYIIENADGTISGIAAEQVDLMFSKLGIDTPVEWKIFPGKDEALAALNNNEIDCINPYYHGYSDGERDGVILSNTIYKSSFSILYHDQYTDDTLSVVATPYTRLGASYVRDNYPSSTILPCQNGYECIQKLDAYEATCVIMYTDALEKIDSTFRRDHSIRSLATECDVCFAALPENASLIYIIDKAIPYITNVERAEIQNKYSIDEHDITLSEFFASHRDGLYAAIAVLALVVLTIVLLERRKDKKYEDRLQNALIDSRRANRIINEQSTFTKFFLEPFQSAYYVGLDDLSCQVYKRTDAITADYPILTNYLDSLTDYIKKEVHPDDQAGLLEIVQPAKMRSLLRTQHEFSYSYKIVSGETEQNIQLQVIRGVDDSHAALGFKDITDEILHEKENTERQHQTEVYRSIIDRFAASFEAVFLGNLTDGSYKVISEKKEISAVVTGTSLFTTAIARYIDQTVHPSDREGLTRDMIHFEEIKSRLPIGQSHSLEYRSLTENGYCWYRATMNRLSEDEVLIGFKDCDEEVVSRIIDEELIDEYDALYIADLDRDEIRSARSSKVSKVGAFLGKASYREIAEKFAETVSPQYKQDWLNFSNVKYMKQYMATEDHREYVYELPEAEKPLRRFTVDVIERINGDAATLLFSFMAIDDLRAQAIILQTKMAEQNAKQLEEQIAHQKQLQTNLDIIKALASDYSSVYYIDLDTEKITPYSMNEETERMMSDIFKKNASFPVAYKAYIEQFVYEPDRAMMLHNGRKKHILKQLAESNSYSITFRTKIDDDVRFCEMRFVIARSENGVVKSLALGFAYKDKEIMAQYINEKLVAEYISAFMVDLDNDKYRIYRHPDTTTVMDREDRKWSLAMTDFAEECDPEYSEIVKNIGSPDYLREELADVDRREYLYRCPSASKPWRRAVVQVIDRKDGVPNNIVATFMGIDDYQSKIHDQEKQLEAQQRQLEDALSMAESANRAKTTFLNNMSHDIRTPMNAIIGFTGLASTHIDNRELVEDYLNKISQSSNHLLSLINDVLDMSRIESGKMNLDEKEENLPEIIHALRDIVQADIRAKKHDFFIDTINVNDENVICDKLRLNQVLLNILSNSIKYTQPGGMISMRITEKDATATGYATYEFCIIDNGMGMDEEYLKTIYEPFTRVKSSTMSGIQGTGLGMAITKNIVDMMGGDITIKSEPGQGTQTTVSFTFKLIDEHKETIFVPELQGHRVLVADDDANTAFSVSSMLEEIGLKSEWCTSGNDAIFRCEKSYRENDAFTAYIIDWLMPDMNGVETTKAIRKTVGPDVPIIILTAYDWTDIEEEARGAGVTAFISKPLFPSDVRKVLLNCLCGSTQPEEAAPLEYDFHGKKLLIVEDNELNREIATNLLSEFGFVVDTASDGDIAVDKIRNAGTGDYDIILMDVQMPTIDGYEATRQIRALGTPISKIPILAMTANAFEEDRRAALEAGMNDHITKPIDVAMMTATVAKYL